MADIGAQKIGDRRPQQRPTAAEIARTIVAGPYSGSILTEWLDTPTPVSFSADSAARIFLFVSDGHPLARVSCLHTNPSADLLVEAVSSARGPDRLIGAVEVTGQFATVPATTAAVALARHARERGLDDVGDLGRLWTLELRPQRLELSLRDTTHRIDIGDYLAAEPDPLAESAHRIAEHLNASHREVLLELIPGARADVDVVVVGLDRYGIELRVDGSARRICFKSPLTRKEELGRELFELRRLRVDA